MGRPIVDTIGQIAGVPLFLHYLTRQTYSKWLVLTAVRNLLWSLEGRRGQTLGIRTNLASRPIWARDSASNCVLGVLRGNDHAKNLTFFIP